MTIATAAATATVDDDDNDDHKTTTATTITSTTATSKIDTNYSNNYVSVRFQSAWPNVHLLFRITIGIVDSNLSM